MIATPWTDDQLESALNDVEHCIGWNGERSRKAIKAEFTRMRDELDDLGPALDGLNQLATKLANENAGLRTDNLRVKEMLDKVLNPSSPSQ